MVLQCVLVLRLNTGLRLQVMISVGVFALFTLTFLVMRVFKSAVPHETLKTVTELPPELVARVQAASSDFRNDTLLTRRNETGWVPLEP